ncbi:bcl-2-like protein [Raccoonpox virus]|uniref:Bcl-2-like protein, IFN-beta inhibitor n=1 Tax=Raccoon poxvirus TaxID=10256 RepID=A0A0G3G2E6_RACVI|nr:Bcl-2-like protein, IFN-beta inhibitor [Raccoonpox virus]AKJ93652.1 Bcl-2-like protein, IFN-beta inhibitor [Raccoonpox virus]AOP31283.1 bcl-2-like protein [Raccoonpox virus]
MDAYIKADSFSLETDSVKDVIKEYICWLSMKDELRPSIGCVFKAMETFKIDAVRYYGDIYELANDVKLGTFDDFVRSVQMICSNRDKLTVYGTMGLLSIVADIHKGRELYSVKYAAGVIMLMDYIFDEIDMNHLKIALYRRIIRRSRKSQDNF